MDWIQGIQAAIDYVEAHITEEIRYEEVAKRAYASPFHFQRVFGILCGFSLGDYIRMRRPRSFFIVYSLPAACAPPQSPVASVNPKAYSLPLTANSRRNGVSFSRLTSNCGNRMG